MARGLDTRVNDGYCCIRRLRFSCIHKPPSNPFLAVVSWSWTATSSSIHRNECSHMLSAGSHATRVRRRLHTSVARGGFSFNPASKRLILTTCPAASTPPRRACSRTSNDRQPSHSDDECACCLGLMSTAPGRFLYHRILDNIHLVSLV